MFVLTYKKNKYKLRGSTAGDLSDASKVEGLAKVAGHAFSDLMLEHGSWRILLPTTRPLHISDSPTIVYRLEVPDAACNFVTLYPKRKLGKCHIRGALLAIYFVDPLEALSAL